jgi:NAD(P)-dependent dehydrogenase (short-subunit alcohol dehydrogenase family)
MSRALILGGTGAIGRATAQRLLDVGWQADLTGRDPAHMPAALVPAPDDEYFAGSSTTRPKTATWPATTADAFVINRLVRPWP